MDLCGILGQIRVSSPKNVVDFLGLPGPDSHWFRFTKTTDMWYVHTLTVCYVNGTWQCPGTQPTCN
jgi:hypothetical protein